ncbi:MAG: Lrp/AsnC family transcriptional regulator [Candidatus Woesearchaeota archaeon]
MEQKELLILHHFRKNARENLKSASKKTGVPISTIHERLKKYQGTLIKKHTVLLDFSLLGYALKVFMVIKAHKKEDVIHFLSHYKQTNSLYRISNGYDIMVEVLFRDLLQYQQFCDELDTYDIVSKQEYFILKELKQEEFLSNDLLKQDQFSQIAQH